MNFELKEKSSEVSKLLKVLSHPKRLLILCFLSENGEQNVSDLEKFCEMSQSQLSQFLAKMKDDNLLESEKKGQFVIYKIKDKRIKKLIKSLSKIFC